MKIFLTKNLLPSFSFLMIIRLNNIHATNLRDSLTEVETRLQDMFTCQICMHYPSNQ